MKGFNLINKDSVIHVYPYGEWSESDNHIEKTIFTPTYDKFKGGDIYFRPSQNGKGVRVQVFTGEGSNFYDQNFGAGTRHFYATVVDINELINYCYKNNSELFQSLKATLKEIVGATIN